MVEIAAEIAVEIAAATATKEATSAAATRLRVQPSSRLLVLIAQATTTICRSDPDKRSELRKDDSVGSSFSASSG
jgi:hypothetical protein